MKFYNFLSPYPTDVVKIDPVVLKKKMLTHDGVIGQLIYSGDLKIYKSLQWILVTEVPMINTFYSLLLEENNKRDKKITSLSKCVL